MRAWCLLSLAALAAVLCAPVPATACPSRGGGDAAFEPELEEIEELVEQARALESAASKEDSKARVNRETARRQRMAAANLRERARVSPELDADIMLAKARVADKEAVAADARAAGHAKRAKTLRNKAAELRGLAKKLLGTDGRGVRAI